MLHVFGDRRSFNIVIGEPRDRRGQVRTVNIWADGRLLTSEDDHAYVPSFSAGIERTILRILSGRDLGLPFPDVSPEENHLRLYAAGDGSHQTYWFIDWGETTDDIASLMFRRGENLILTFETRPQTTTPEPVAHGVLAVEMPERELLMILVQAAFAFFHEMPWFTERE